MPTKVKWNGPEATKPVVSELRLRVQLAAEALKTQVQKNISVSTRASGPSKPGEYPHADTGRLRQNVFWGWLYDTPKRTVAKVGTNLDYGLRLEMDMDRSYLRRTLFEMTAKIKAILAKPIK